MSEERNQIAAVPVTATPARRRFGLATVVCVALASAGLSTLVEVQFAGTSKATPAEGVHADGTAAFYQCPMHPTVVRDHPGTCPICGMTLVRIAWPTGDAAPGAAGPRHVRFYRSPMDPTRTSPVPARDEMGMAFLPVYDDTPADGSAVTGFGTVEIDPDRQQLIGLRTAEVTRGKVGGAWRTVGRVAIDETRVWHVNLKVSGFVERVFVDYVGKKVRRGDPLFTLYSPELLAAQEEYLLARTTDGELARLGDAGGERDHGLASASRRKLELWDIPDSEIDALVARGRPTKTLTFYAPATGVVTRKDVVDGMKLDAGAMPYEVADLSSVWVLADVYESELRFVREGMAATLTLAAFPDREFKGKVVFLDPLLDPQTRTVKVRVTVPNPAGDLRPDMFGEVVLLGVPHDALRVPPDAVIDSGTEKIVFVAVGGGKFRPRVVKLGEGDEANVEVVSGLALGDRVVVRANFLVDSESRLRASLAGMTGSGRPKAPESARVLPEREGPATTSIGHAGHAP
jgi:Cu(I)/Ag(I) efflux system membrane fusion protein